MKIKLTAVLLCFALLLTLSLNVFAETAEQLQSTVDTQITTVAEEITVNVDEDAAERVTQPVIEPITNDDGISTTATGAIPIGHLDTVNSSIIGGWAYQSDIPSTPLAVHFYINKQSTGQTVEFLSTTAGGYRPDLAAAGYGDGYHAFQCAMDWSDYPAGNYSVEAYAIGTHGVNPQLDGSPKIFTVRAPTGNIEYVDSTGVGGWAWKPDAPNNAINVHIYIYKSDGTQVAFYPVTASQPRSDLAAAGYGNGAHGFSQTIDWSSLPEERLRVVVYAVDGSGYNPSFYSGYYNNLPIRLIGMIDDEGKDFSAWATQEVINYAEDISAPRVVKCTGATQENLIEYIHNSRFATVFTHGTQYTLEWKANANTDSETKGLLDWREVGVIDVDCFSNTDCLLLLSCSTASEEDGAGNNIAKTIKSKGIGAVVAFKNTITAAFANNKTSTTQYVGYWGKVFLRELGAGSTVKSAKIIAFSELVQKQREVLGINTSELEILIDTDPEYVNKHVYCGTNSCVILGDADLVVKR